MTEWMGGCHCGAVRFRATGEPLRVNHCHCRDCQRISGAPFVTWATFPTASVTFTAGRPRRFASSAKVERAFCPDCGTPLLWQAKANPDQLDLTAAGFDRPGDLRPQEHLWTERELPWIHLADGLPRYKRFRDGNPL